MAAKKSQNKKPTSRAASREHLIQATIEIILSKGIDAVRTEEICEQVGVTRGSLYWHFASREDLIREALAEQLRRLNNEVATGLTAALEDATSRNDYLARIAPVVAQNFDTSQNDDRWTWLRLLVATHDDPALFNAMSEAQIRSHRAYEEMMAMAKERGYLHPAVDPGAMAMVLRAVTLGSVLFEFVGDDAPSQDEWFGLMLFLIDALFPASGD